MQSIHLSRPDPLTQFVDGQVAQGRGTSSSEYGREVDPGGRKVHCGRPDGRETARRPEQRRERPDASKTGESFVPKPWRSWRANRHRTLMPMVYQRVATRRELVIYLDEQVGFNTVETMK